MNEKGFIQYIVIIGIILAVAFLSQGGSLLGFLGQGKTFTFVNDAMSQAQAYLAKGSNWVADKVFPGISSEVQKRGEMVREGVEKEKEKITESATEKIKNYFSGITESVLHPGTPQNCEPPENSYSQ